MAERKRPPSQGKLSSRHSSGHSASSKKSVTNLVSQLTVNALKEFRLSDEEDVADPQVQNPAAGQFGRLGLKIPELRIIFLKKCTATGIYQYTLSVD